MVGGELGEFPEHGHGAGRGEGEMVKDPARTVGGLGRKRGEESEEEIGNGRPAQEMQQVVKTLSQSVPRECQVQGDHDQRSPARIPEQPQEPTNGGKVIHADVR